MEGMSSSPQTNPSALSSNSSTTPGTLRNPAESQRLQTSSNERQVGSPRITDEELNRAIDRVNKALQLDNTSLQFEYDKETKRNVAQIVDKNTGEIVRQIPSKEFMDWEKEFLRVTGLLFDKQV